VTTRQELAVLQTCVYVFQGQTAVWATVGIGELNNVPDEHVAQSLDQMKSSFRPLK